MSFKNILLSFRLSEYLFSVLLVAILTALSIHYYRSYILSAYSINQFFVLADVKTRVAIDYAYTGLPQGSKILDDYKGVVDDDSIMAKDVVVSEGGHISIEVKNPPKGYYGHSLLSSIDGQRLSLYRTVNDQGAYVFHSWQCHPKGNAWPYTTVQSNTESLDAQQYFGIYCREKNL